jgi:hypothetical protein
MLSQISLNLSAFSTLLFLTAGILIGYALSLPRRAPADSTSENESLRQEMASLRADVERLQAKCDSMRAASVTSGQATAEVQKVDVVDSTEAGCSETDRDSELFGAEPGAQPVDPATQLARLQATLIEIQDQLQHVTIQRDEARETIRALRYDLDCHHRTIETLARQQQRDLAAVQPHGDSTRREPDEVENLYRMLQALCQDQDRQLRMLRLENREAAASLATEKTLREEAEQRARDLDHRLELLRGQRDELIHSLRRQQDQPGPTLVYADQEEKAA